MTFRELHEALEQAHKSGTRADIRRAVKFGMRFGMSIGGFIPDAGDNHDQVACCLIDAVERGGGQDGIRAHNAGVKAYAG